jgi:hypothetical protein
MHPTDAHDLACVVHVHSTCSDGTATVPEIAHAAGEAEADAVLLTDHDSLDARRQGQEGWHGRVLILVGHEVTPERGHLLAFGLDHEVAHSGRSEREMCREVIEAGGLAFPAHPFSTGTKLFRRKGRPHPWDCLDCGFTGVELWSLGTDCAEAWASKREILAFLRNPLKAIDHPPLRNLAAWDRLCNGRRTVAIGGLDAHQNGVRFRGRVLTATPNHRFFRLLQTHVLCDRPPSGELADDAQLVYAALREGSCYMAVDALEPARGFRLWAEDDGKLVPMGAEGASDDWTIRASLPRRAELRLIRDGRVVQSTVGSTLEARAAEPGVYRLEARLEADGKARTWIVSNPLYLRPGNGNGAHSESGLRAAPVSEPA